MKLTKNFKLQEFLMSQTAARHDREINADDTIITNLTEVAETLEEVRELCGNKPIFISSGYRPNWLNFLIGGAKNSQHTKGQAVDFVVAGMSVYDIADAIAKSNIEFDQLIYEFGSWVHLSYNIENNRGDLLSAIKEKNKTIYLKGIIHYLQPLILN